MGTLFIEIQFNFSSKGVEVRNLSNKPFNHKLQIYENFKTTTLLIKQAHRFFCNIIYKQCIQSQKGLPNSKQLKQISTRNRITYLYITVKLLGSSYNIFSKSQDSSHVLHPHGFLISKSYGSYTVTEPSGFIVVFVNV